MALNGKPGKQPFMEFSHTESPVCLDRLHIAVVLTKEASEKFSLLIKNQYTLSQNTRSSSSSSSKSVHFPNAMPDKIPRQDMKYRTYQLLTSSPQLIRQDKASWKPAFLTLSPVLFARYHTAILKASTKTNQQGSIKTSDWSYKEGVEGCVLLHIVFFRTVSCDLNHIYLDTVLLKWIC